MTKLPLSPSSSNHGCLSRHAFSVSTSSEEMSRIRARSSSNMLKSLCWYDLIGFGISGMVRVSFFVTTGRASSLNAGPAIVISYTIAGICTLLSVFCYTEFAVDIPVAGGSFSYLCVIFGEFVAFLTGASLIIEYVISNAAVAHGFTAYFGTAIGVSTSKWRLTVNGLPNSFNEINVIAVAVVLLITFINCSFVGKRGRGRARGGVEEEQVKETGVI